MARYLIIDHESKAVKQLQDSISSFDQSAQFFNYASLEHLNEYKSHLSKNEESLFFDFKLIIITVPHPLPQKWYQELQKFTEYFLQNHHYSHKQLSPEELSNKNKPELSQIILTGHELLPAHNKLLRQLHIYNYIFKPFDETLLKEQLHLACHNEVKTRSLELKSQDASAYIAFLKEVELQSLSEIGFMTLSDVQIPIKSISKYFSPLFLNGKKQSAWAQCLVSLPHPTKQNTFINKFHFTNPQHGLLQSLRKHLKIHQKDQISSTVWNFDGTKNNSQRKLNCGLFCTDSDEFLLIKSDLESQFANVNFESIELNEDSKKYKKYHHLDLVINFSDAKFDLLKLYFADHTQYFLFTQSALDDEKEIKSIAQNYSDVFTFPLDKSYFHKKLKLHFNFLNFRDDHTLTHITCHEKIKAATMVKMTDISEIMVNLNYSRPLDLRSFREFVFISQDETQSIELPAFCHFADTQSQTNAEGHKEFFHQFVFFAVNDHHLKQIRLWILQNYIEHNEQKA